MGRRELREHIFRLLFRTEFHSEAEMTEQEDFYLAYLGEISDEDRAYIQGKVNAIIEKKADLDSRINSVADKWKTERMTKVDLTIIRLASYEIIFDEEALDFIENDELVEITPKSIRMRKKILDTKMRMRANRK